MKLLPRAAWRFLRQEQGATMVEYALVVAAIALVVVIGARTMGNSASTKFDAASGQLT